MSWAHHVMFCPGMPTVAHPRAAEASAAALLLSAGMACGIMVSVLVLALAAQDPRSFCRNIEEGRAVALQIFASGSKKAG